MADLCDDCRWCLKVKGFGREVKSCQIISPNPNFPVESCAAFEPKTSTTLYEMKEMAIYIEKKKDAPGFSFTKKKMDTYDLPE